MIWVLKLFWSAFTGDLFKFYTVIPTLAGAAGFWSTGSSTPEGDTPGATSPMIDGGTVDSPPTTVNTVQVFPDVEFTYTYWLYGRKELSADDENHPFYYLKLDPVIKGANVTVTNGIYITESLVPTVGSASSPDPFFRKNNSGSDPRFADPDVWNTNDFPKDENNQVILPFWFNMTHPDRTDNDKVDDSGRPLKYFAGYEDYLQYLNNTYYTQTSSSPYISSNATAGLITDKYTNAQLNTHSGTIGGTNEAIKATISGYYTYDELFDNITAKYVPIGQSDLSTPNISLGGNQVNYSGLLSDVPQGQEVYQLTPDSRQQVSVPIRIYYRRARELALIFETGAGQIVADQALSGHTEYSTSTFTSRQNYADKAFSGTFLKHTQDYSKVATFLSTYYTSTAYTEATRERSSAVSY